MYLLTTEFIEEAKTEILKLKQTEYNLVKQSENLKFTKL